MILHTESWILLAPSEITPAVSLIIDHLLETRHKINRNVDGYSIRFDSELSAKAIYHEIEQAWDEDSESEDDDDPPNVRDHRAGRCDIAKQKRSLWPAPVHRLVGRRLNWMRSIGLDITC